MVLMWLLSGGRRTLFPVPGIPDTSYDAASGEKDAAMRAFRARLEELAARAEERMQQASSDQIKELKTLQDKPLEEVAKWIDDLS